MTLREIQAFLPSLEVEEAPAARRVCEAIVELAPHTLALLWRRALPGNAVACVTTAAGARAPEAVQAALTWASGPTPAFIADSAWDEADDRVVQWGWPVRPATGAAQGGEAGARCVALAHRLLSGRDCAWYLTVLCGSAADAEILAPAIATLGREPTVADAASAVAGLIERSSALTLLLSRDGVEYANAAALRTLGYSRAELCAPESDPLRVVHPRDRHRIRELWEGESTARGAGGVLECTLEARNGAPVDVLATFTRQATPTGPRLLLNAIDISDRVRLETELFTYTGHVGALQELLIELLELDWPAADMLDRMCRSLVSIIGSDCAAAVLKAPAATDLSLEALHGTGHALDWWRPVCEAAVRAGDEPHAGEVRRALDACLARHEVVTPQLPPRTRKSCAHVSGQVEVRSCLLVPLAQGVATVGALILGFDRADPALTDSQVHSLKLFAAQAALAVRKAQLVARERLQQAQSMQLLEANATLQGDLPPHSLYGRICTGARRLVPSAQAALFVAEGDALVLRRCDGSPPATPAAEPAPLTAASTQELLAALPPEHVVDTGPLVAALRARLDRSTGPFFAAPFISEQHVLGILTLAGPKHGAAYSEGEKQLIATFASHAAATLRGCLLLAEITETKDRLEHLFESASDIIYTLDREGQVLSMNAMGRELLGLPADRSALPHLRDIVHAEDLAAAVPGKLHANGTNAGPGPLAIRLRDSTGEYRTLELTTRVLDQLGEPGSILVIGRDVTRRQRLEAQLRRTERLTALGSLLANVAHELNNPLAGVLGYAQLLLESQDPQVRTQAQHIHGEAQRCRTIVDSLLALHPDAHMPAEPVALGPLLDQTVALVAYGFGSQNVGCTATYPRELPTVEVPADQVQRALLQLLQNACEAIQSTGAGGSIVIRAEPAGEDVSVLIEDDGPGIEPHLYDKLFDPFYTTREGPGRGLGLSMVSNVLAALGGGIRLEPREPRGTRVVLTLPVTAPRGSRPQPPPKPAPEPRPAAGKRVLVIDDEDVIRDLLRDLLELLDYTVDVAKDGRAGLELLAKHDYAAIVSDVKMPGMDGMQFFARVQEQYPHLASRVLFASGDTIASDTREFLRAAGRPYICKPFNLSDLRAAVQAVVEPATATD